MNRAESFRIESEGPPDGFVLTITDDYGNTFRVSIQSIALEVEATVRRELRPYALEAEHARATMPPSQEEADAYERTDPKHPDWHSTLAELADA